MTKILDELEFVCLEVRGWRLEFKNVGTAICRPENTKFIADVVGAGLVSAQNKIIANVVGVAAHGDPHINI